MNHDEKAAQEPALTAREKLGPPFRPNQASLRLHSRENIVLWSVRFLDLGFGTTTSPSPPYLLGITFQKYGNFALIISALEVKIHS